MSSHFSCIGFPIRQMSECEALMREAAAKGERLPLPGGGMLARWEVGDGPEIWALVDARGEVIDATPFYHIGTPLRVAVTAHGEDPDEEAEGWVEGWVEPVEPDEPISGAFPVRIDLGNFPLGRARLRVGGGGPIGFCGVAHEAALYEDAGAYETAGRGQYQPPMRSFLSLSRLAAGDPEGEPEATAVIPGIVADAPP